MAFNLEDLGVSYRVRKMTRKKVVNISDNDRVHPLQQKSWLRVGCERTCFHGGGADIWLWEFKHPRVHAVQLMYVSSSDKMTKYLPIPISYVLVLFNF